jgi:hypothetical protein
LLQVASLPLPALLRIAARRRVAVILRVIQPGATRPPARLEEPEDTGQAGNDILDDAVGAHALERQHCDRRRVGYRVPRRSHRLLRDSRLSEPRKIRTPRAFTDPS